MHIPIMPGIQPLTTEGRSVLFGFAPIIQDVQMRNTQYMSSALHPHFCPSLNSSKIAGVNIISMIYDP